MNESSWTLVAELPLSQNLDGVARDLNRKGIVHKVVQEPQRQLVWVENPDDIEYVDQLLTEKVFKNSSNPWFNPASQGRRENAAHSAGISHTSGEIKRLFERVPVVMWCLLLSTVGAVITYLFPRIELELMFQGFYLTRSGVQLETVGAALARGEYWRLITPIFLHFGWMHLVFNSLWVWVFGTKIELFAGSLRFMGLVLLTGLAGNVAQYLVSGPSLFGGMSGVNYGLLGYLWIRHKFAPHPLTALPAGLVGFMLAFLVLAMFGVFNFLTSGGIANAAHVGGLVAGMAAGWVSAQLSQGK